VISEIVTANATAMFLKFIKMVFSDEDKKSVKGIGSFQSHNIFLRKTSVPSFAEIFHVVDK